MRVLLDSNVLARAAQPGHAQFISSAEALRALLQDESMDPCIVPQVVYEFWVVATRPVASNGLGLSVHVARGEVRSTCRSFTLLRDERGVFSAWHDLVTRYDIAGKAAHDARLVAAMLRHGISRILTFNTRDFARYEEVSALSPEAFLLERRGGPPDHG